MNSFFERLKEERKRLGKTQDEFASIAGITRNPYSSWEKGSTAPDARQLKALSEAGADVQYIVTGIRSDVALTPDERQLLALYRSASLTGKAAAVGALRGVLGGTSGVAAATTRARDVSVGRGGTWVSGQQFNAPVEAVTQHGSIVKVGKEKQKKK